MRESWTILVGLSIMAGLCGCAQQDSERTPSAASQPQPEETENESENSDELQDVGEMASPEDQPVSVEAEAPEVAATDEASSSSTAIQPSEPIHRAKLPSAPTGSAGPQSVVKVRRQGETTERRGYTPERV